MPRAPRRAGGAPLPRAGPALALLLALVLAPAPARAEIPIYEGETVRFGVGGYVRTLSGVQLTAIEDIPGVAEVPPTLGLSQTITRLEWKLDLGRDVTLEVHNRLALTVTSAELPAGGGLGAGVTRAPPRSLDLRSVLADEPGLLLDHDLDRLLVRARLGDVDLVVGRQAISWGTSILFQVADAWAAFSPFDLDTSQKRGLDALRVSAPIGDGLVLDAVIADRGSVEDLSGGVRLVAYLDQADVHVGLAKQWRQLAAMAGVSFAFDTTKLRGEVWGAWDAGEEAWELPRATLGFDWFSGDLTLMFEAHYNGAGTDDPDAYLAHAGTSRHLARGEVYLLGRYYLGAAARYLLLPDLELGLSVMMNLLDPSALLTTTLRYDIAENVDLVLGAFNGLGAGGDLAAGRLGSELGSYGHLVFAQLAAFF